MSYTNRTTEFHKIYKEQILPILRNYEVYRQREYNKHKIWIGMFVLLIAFSIISFIPGSFIQKLIFSSGLSTVGFAFLLIFMASLPSIIIFGVPFYFIRLHKKSKGFAITLKVDCLEKILQIFGDIKWQHKDTLDYNDKNTIHDETITNSGLFLNYNHREDDDCFYGTHNEVPFKILETHIWEERGSGKNRQAITAHKGVIIEFETNKHTTNRTIIQTKGDMTAKQAPFAYAFITLIMCLQPLAESHFSILSIILTVLVVSIVAIIAIANSKKQEPLNKVTLEDVTFNKRFDVYSSDQTEARYMITTAFMERFYKIKTAFKAKNIKCSFIGNKLIMALQTNKDLFEIGSLYKSLESPTSINEFYNELSSILQMVEYFKLDEKTRL